MLPSLTLPGDRFRRSPRLEAVLLADAARERARAVRDLLIALLAILGLPLWLLAALVRERWWSRVRSRRVEALGPLPRLRSERLGRAACATPPDEED